MGSIFSHGYIGDLELKNRIIMPAMKTGFADQNSRPQERYIDFLEARAKGGAGLIIAESLNENVAAIKESDVFNKKNSSWMEVLTRRIHAVGAKIALQLSYVPDTKGALQKNYYEAVLQAFVNVAEVAAAANFDALEIQGCFFDKADDTHATKNLFYKNLFASLQEKIKIPLIYRLAEEETINLKDALHACKTVEAAGAAAIHIPVSLYQTLEPPGFLIHLSAAVKKAVRLPVIAAGRINRLELAAETLKHGAADFISMGRAFLADPDLLRKAEQGSMDDIRPCICCNEGCVNRFMTGEPITCIQNLAVGREKELSSLPRVKTPKNILVIGGGPAGMIAAKYLAKRGHHVRLVEQSAQLGGQVNIAALVPGKQDYRFIVTCLQADLAAAGVEIMLSTTSSYLPDAEKGEVVLASGSAAKILSAFPALSVPQLTAREAISSGSNLNVGQVVVIGGGLLGLEAAYALATRGKDVLIVEQEKEIARDGASVYRNHLLKKLENSKVDVLTETVVLSGEGAEVKLQNLLSGETKNVQASGGLVMAVGSSPVYPETLKGHNKKLHVIGDAHVPGKILEAMEGALALAIKL